MVNSRDTEPTLLLPTIAPGQKTKTAKTKTAKTKAKAKPKAKTAKKKR